MSQSNSDLFSRMKTPPFQAACVGVLILVCAGILKILILTHAMTDVNPILFWVIGGAGILFYSLMNSVISLAAGDMNRYWIFSTLSYVALAVSCAVMAYTFSGVAIDDAGSFRWIFTVLTFGYLLFLSLMRFLRKIVQVAQKEDDRWQDRSR